MRKMILLACLVGIGLRVTGEPMQAETTTEAANVTSETNLTANAAGAKTDHRGRAFIGLKNFDSWTRTQGENGASVLTSAELPTNLPANEIVVSWNADAPETTGIKVEARAFAGEQATKWYVMGLWSKTGTAYPRESVKGQKDDNGEVQTDTLVLKRPAERVQVRVTLRPTLPPVSTAGEAVSHAIVMPTLKYVGVCLTDTTVKLESREPHRQAWGKEVTVPSRTQSGWPGASGWCSPTSTDMTLAFWSQKLRRPELDLPVPDAAHAIYDKVYDGTGNWPFNTAFAGSFPQMRAYVTRFSDIRELEEWTLAGLPVVVSVSYDLLKGKATDNDPGHLMVCDGFTTTGDIVLNDPAHRPDKGETARSIWPRANFLRGWERSHGTVYLIYPEGAKVPADRYGHWDTAR